MWHGQDNIRQIKKGANLGVAAVNVLVLDEVHQSVVDASA